jgi:hypothetical protein
MCYTGGMSQLRKLSLSKLHIALSALAALILLAAYTWAFQAVFTSRVPSANDFFSRWAGARLYFTRGWDPYGQETSLWIQNAIWGHPATPDEDPSLFAYPFYTVFLVAPYALIGDYSWAQAAWQVTLQVVALAALGLTLAYHRWRPRPLMLGALVLWMLGFYPTARSLLLGQIGLAVFAMTVWALWLMRRSSDPPLPQGQEARSASDANLTGQDATDLLAGALLAVTTVKPQMQFLIIPFALLWAWRERRWMVMAGFGATLAVLLGVSFALLPTWLFDWLAQVSRYPSYTPPAVLFVLTHQVLALGASADLIQRVLVQLLIAYLLAEWWLVLRLEQDHRFDWTIGVTLVVTHLVAPRTATTHFVVFVFPLVALYRHWSRRRRWGTWAVVGLMAFLLVGMWWLFLATLDGAQEHNIVHVPLPLLTLALAWVGRPGRALSPED